MVWIAGQTLGSAGSITFSSIPQTFTHLQVRLTSRSDYASTTASVFMRFNGDSGANYVYHYLLGDGSSATSGASTGSTVAWVGNMPAASSTANVFASTIVDILDYTNTNKNKTTRSLDGYDTNGAGQTYLSSNLWLNTAAITSILLVSGGGANFVANTRADLYGITSSEVTGA
jgi:hypothetical protein